MRLRGKCALVTGASRSIGAAIARAYAREGADVVITYARREVEAQEIVDELVMHGVRARAFQADFAEPGVAEQLVQEACDFLGGLDILVNNAGVPERTPSLELSTQDYLRTLQINSAAPLRLCQLVVPWMERQGGGSIINITSIAGTRPLAGRLAYGVSKVALNRITQVLALELGEKGIRVNAIAPGMTASGMFERTISEEPDKVERLRGGVPIGRLGEPSDYAGAAVILASEEAHYVTGQIWVIDGGFTLAAGK